MLTEASPATLTTTAATPAFTPEEVASFQQDGYLIVRGLADAALCETLLACTRAHLAEPVEPVEYEADLHYPGAPPARNAEGGMTVRRLKQAHGRHPAFTQLVTQPTIVTRLQQLLGPRVVMPLAHHNCVMTKQPQFSSETHWHQDIRYWSYTRPELVSLWLALGRESVENGCLFLIPGTHTQTFDRARLDEALFLRPDLPENAALIARKVPAELERGDVLFFHSRTFHAAGKNRTDQSKFSVVFTFRPADNPPLRGSRSASHGELLLPEQP